VKDLIGIVDYGVSGNIFSVRRALEEAGADVFIISKPSDFHRASKLVIPGVGSFKDAMKHLSENDLIKPIQSFENPILGICLGMHILATVGYEYGRSEGLGLIDAEVVALRTDSVTPHLGFQRIDVVKSNSLLTNCEGREFYFMHSFEIVKTPNVASTSEYSNHKFISSIHDGNVYGVQFHPEKSRQAGIDLFKNFINI